MQIPTCHDISIVQYNIVFCAICIAVRKGDFLVNPNDQGARKSDWETTCILLSVLNMLLTDYHLNGHTWSVLIYFRCESVLKTRQYMT